MIRFLNKATIEERVEDKAAADALHEKIENESGTYVLSAWSETQKEKKSKGEIIDSWMICKYTLTFNDPKEPVIALDSIEYNMIQPNVIDTVMNTIPWED